MKWNNVKLIYAREMRDQLRDRRTLFLIAVLPLLLYPLMGMGFFQVSQFLRNTAAKVLVLGEGEILDHDWLPPLLGEKKFDPALFTQNPQERDKLQITNHVELIEPQENEEVETEEISIESALAAMREGEVQVVVHFPVGFGNRLKKARESLMGRSGNLDLDQLQVPKPLIYYISANEKSRIAWMRVDRVLRNWRQKVMETNLRDGNVPLQAAKPFVLVPQDVAEEQQRHAALWSKVLPFILFIWALTGAFYPAVDLCAGEKERGTLETLLTSPAQRREIVWGKLLTIMSFSVATAILNLGSMGITGKFVLSQFQGITGLGGEGGVLAMPPMISLVWLCVALLPVSALFSALCLACAAFARSTKEGQYYLMPLVLVITPLMFLPMSPGVELGLGNSLIPITGVVLLLRAMIEGQYWVALQYVVPVVVVTSMCVLLAIRWAEDQFNSESVLFRESERIDLRQWLVHLVRDRTETPTFAQAILGVGLILVIQFFVNLAVSSSAVGREIDFEFLVLTFFISQVVCIALPATLLTLLFTSQRKRTLLLNRLPNIAPLVAGMLLAVFVRPLGSEFVRIVLRVYPISEDMQVSLDVMGQALQLVPNWWILLGLMAVLPAVCEEIAFRGFILSGLRHVGHKWWAIGLSAVAFGMAHSILQQQIAAAAVGLVLGYLAVQSGSLLVCVLFHAIYNGLGLFLEKQAQLLNEGLVQSPWNWILTKNPGENDFIFQPWVLIVALVGSGLILWWLHYLPYQRTKEEQLQEARESQYVGA